MNSRSRTQFPGAASLARLIRARWSLSSNSTEPSMLAVSLRSTAARSASSWELRRISVTGSTISTCDAFASGKRGGGQVRLERYLVAVRDDRPRQPVGLTVDRKAP